MNIRGKIALVGMVLAMGLSGCKVTYSLSGASIAPEVQTVTINYFQNNATLVLPSLSTTLTESLQDRFVSQTRLTVVRENGDMNFEGEITNCTSTPSSISGENMLSRTVYR